MLLELLWGLNRLRVKHLVCLPTARPCLSHSVPRPASSRYLSKGLCRASRDALWLCAAGRRHSRRQEDRGSVSLFPDGFLLPVQAAQVYLPFLKARDKLPVSCCSSGCCELSIARDGPWALNMCLRHHLFMTDFSSAPMLSVPTSSASGLSSCIQFPALLT